MTFIFTDEPINTVDELLNEKVVYYTKWKALISPNLFTITHGNKLAKKIQAGRFKKYQEVKM